MQKQDTHWADITAEKIIRQKSDKPVYICASGITPSGTIHIGNFREIISTELVVRALKQKGKQVRFIYSWDDYDVFRKVPDNMPAKEMLKTHLRKPITQVPDPYGTEKSYARRNEKELEALLPLVGVKCEFIYQARQYSKSVYAAAMKKVLEKRETIIHILNQHRKKPLAADWWPISIFCGSCHKDTTKVESWDGDFTVKYSCLSCAHKEELHLEKTGLVKLFWRVDWPMRWAFEGVDFEPAGKEHHSAGGSFDTAKKIVKAVYEYDPPVTFKYDFISIKGGGGKISSSSGEVIGLKDVLEIYQPEIVRYLFAGTRYNTEFAISFDLDVIKIYEDYDRCERIYFGKEEVSPKKITSQKRIYELSQVEKIPQKLPFQVPFRHLCNILQINEGNIQGTIDFFKHDLDNHDKELLKIRANCAWNWIKNYAPQSFRFSLRSPQAPPFKLNPLHKQAIHSLRQVLVDKFDKFNEKSLSEAIYSIAQTLNIPTKEFFQLIYRVLIDKERGPRLAPFILTVGKEKILVLLERY